MFFRKIRALGMIILFIALVLSACSKKADEAGVFDAGAYEGELAVYFFHLEGDEKMGESILVKTPEGQTILIDAGLPEAGPTVDGYLDELGVDKLDYVMPSHPHHDHIGGLQTIFATKEVGKVIEVDVPHSTKPYKEYKRLIKNNDIDVEIGEAGDVLELEDDLTLEIFNPPKGTDKDSMPEGYTDQSASVINNESMVMKLTYKDKSFLFTGDIYTSREVELVNDFDDELKSNVVVAPHHGHDTSSSQLFIKTVDPDITMIPSNILFEKQINNRYDQSGSDVYHSYEYGNVVLVSDGETIDVMTEKEPEEEE